ncbi:GNAT family N-acetyltransferase [Nocardia zapadnayensis]|uniref:GNAT family protein n=1 Tax=Brevibacterium pityocampae TaxID=506594 RepID=A0ABP8JKE8_9MICO|nr:MULTISPECIES: GNAT family protein [Actinomycetes]MCK1801572.1 GNAT family N-acetyltransferase [Brevibacterium sp. R8603A2]MCX0275873.1 GNAT family N-acetyltransferase [Nocardia zapadnayensis]
MTSPDARAFASAPDLTGERVTLTQLTPAHAEALSRAAGELTSTWVTSVPTAEAMPAEIDRRLGLQEQGAMAPFTVLDGGTPVGMSTYMNIDAANRRLEIGSTWLSPAVQGTRVNPEAKLLMLSRAFEELDCIAVEFRTHFHNFQSRAAIAKLGAKQDGVLRSHQLFNGVLRDTAVYSIIAAEWPTVKLGLEHRLARLS